MSREYIKALLGGTCIGMGGLAFLSVGGGISGAFLFSVGLLTICMFDYNLFTGKVCYAEPTRGSVGTLCIILIGNFLGAAIMGLLTQLMRPDLVETARTICMKKVSEGWRVIPLGLVCNVLIFFAVAAWKKFEVGIPGTFMIILCVMVFILSGTEHCIANIYYFSVGGRDAIPAVVYLFMNAVGNSIGGILAYRLTRATK